MHLIAHSVSGNKASGAEDCGNSISNPGDGQSNGRLPPSTAAAGNFISECLSTAGTFSCVTNLTIPLCQMQS
jgi:hypothetical protein